MNERMGSTNIPVVGDIEVPWRTLMVRSECQKISTDISFYIDVVLTLSISNFKSGPVCDFNGMSIKHLTHLIPNKWSIDRRIHKMK